MHRRQLRPALLAAALCVPIAGLLGLTWGTAWAHNSLVSSDPADGAVLTAPPTQITWQFANPVPLETLTVTLTEASGTRSELPGSAHGPLGDTQVITPLPVVQSGAVSVRWRLVGADGHPITGSVDFTIASPTPSTAPTTTPATTAVPPTSTTPAPTTPASTAPAALPVPIDGSSPEAADGWYSTSSTVRWLLRYSSYLAIIAVVGILLVTASVWSGTGEHPIVRRVLSRSLVATAVLGFLQLLVVASDVGGTAPWASVGSVGAATTTDAGMAFTIRILLALTLWVLLFQSRIVHADIFWTAVSLPGLGLLATWALAGHSRSMRWPVLGVVSDIVHHGAAAAWLAGLAVVGWIIIPSMSPEVLVPVVRRFSRVAAACVAVLVVTGLVQTVRLVGSPFELLAADHGRYLAAKLGVLVVMLGLANANRQIVDRHLGNPRGLKRHTHALRRAVFAEFAIGLVILAVTSAMVVSPPAAGKSAARDRAGDPSIIYYIM